ncbi:hypothetical protein FZI85_27410 [Mycobacterium sp. CBMA293]|uniref:Uncharacterized protein n=1 Tax=Mycolicibacterium sp. CBMA 213 TaxID=1968788 RepID=A0A1S6GKN2_9MYCO|nr:MULTISPECIES: hypothetical protein [unclassified Mycolicibacterium]AQS22421.1 hypothetical protein pCBMA213_2_00057 [Mycolicibacterium sp. CBMA 213]MUL48477.1 hypothetical protein [Mycolicibacterium sp. CBMA 360]MUL62335.1 hypothetical protein [Mycolicibacterium sp. CBMA 335]MUM04472.1 hypothetical protein [Mycolicibacterium sp. CBMA 213]MUM14735.1 hypothetical protein [Mycolicibacterium sp. CBMA 293]
MNDPERFLTDYCRVLGTAATSVKVVQFPGTANPHHATDALTGQPPLETEITVQLDTDTLVASGIDLAEGLTAMMTELRLRKHPLPQIITNLSTVSGARVTDDEYLDAYPPAARSAAENGPFAPYAYSGHGRIGEYELTLLLADDPAVPPLLHAEASNGQLEFHLIPLDGRQGMRKVAGDG